MANFSCLPTAVPRLSTTLIILGLSFLRADCQDQAAPKSESDPRIKTLEMRAREAKVAGRSQVEFPTGVVDPVFTTGLQDILSKYSAVVASVTAEETLVGKSSMYTWYVLHVESELVHHVPVLSTLQGVSSLPARRHPLSLLPMGPDSVLVELPGGTTVIGGVTVTERETGDHSLQLGQRYLFILDVSADGTLGYLPIGSAGVFAIGVDGDTLSPLTSRHHPVTDDVRTKFTTLSQVEQTVAKPNEH